MTNYINTNELDEFTQDFLSSFPSHTHMSWSEWQEKAEAYGLDEKEIAELQHYLEVNNQLTSPMRFAWSAVVVDQTGNRTRQSPTAIFSYQLGSGSSR
jgi:hypothetical protein